MAKTFDINHGSDIFSGLVLTDNLGFPIPKNLLADIIKNFHKGSMFYVNVEYQISDSRQGTIEIVTPLVSHLLKDVSPVSKIFDFFFCIL